MGKCTACRLYAVLLLTSRLWLTSTFICISLTQTISQTQRQSQKSLAAVQAQLVDKFLAAFLLRWACQGWTAQSLGHTCSARNRTPFSPSSSKVSPRMGLKGFQVRSFEPKGPRQKPAIHASLCKQVCLLAAQPHGQVILQNLAAPLAGCLLLCNTAAAKVIDSKASSIMCSKKLCTVHRGLPCWQHDPIALCTP